MISKRIAGRKDGRSSASDALGYGEGLKGDRETGELLDKSHRTRLGNFGLVDDGVYIGRAIAEMADMIEMAAFEMQANCDLNTRVGEDKKLAHFVVSYNQEKPSEAVLRDTEDSMIAVMELDKNHFATFLHNDNGYWHLHLFVSRIEKDKSHRCNALWHDQIKRDKVCREIEIRHNLPRDNGLHIVDDRGQIVEIPREQRIANRNARSASLSDKAKKTEIYSGEKSFQTWANEIRIGDRLKHATSWQDLHAAAAAYGCEVREKGAGFIICPSGEKGGIQLSKVGLKNLPAKFGAFQSAKLGSQLSPEITYKPEPTNPKAASHYGKWRELKGAFKPVKNDRLNEQRNAHKQRRDSLRAQHKSELEKIRAGKKGQERAIAVSVAKMEQAISLTQLAEQIVRERQALRKQLAEQGPGNTFRDYLVKEAAKGDDKALALAQKYGADEATEVSRKREADQFKIVAAVSGAEARSAVRIHFTHRVERNGTVVFNLGQGRTITDSAVSRQVQLNAVAANNPEAIATALRFAVAKYGNTLTLTGSQEFQRMAVETAVLKGLGIKFADPVLEAYREKFAAEQQRNFPTTLKENQNASNHRRKFPTRIPPAHRRDRLHHLSDGDMVLDTSRDVGALRQNVSDRLEQPQEGLYYGLQRAAGGATRAGSAIAVRAELPSANRNAVIDTGSTGSTTASAYRDTGAFWLGSGGGAPTSSASERGGFPNSTVNSSSIVATERVLPEVVEGFNTVDPILTEQEKAKHFANAWGAVTTLDAVESSGKVVAIEDDLVIQHTGRGKYVMHKLVPGSRIPKEGDVVTFEGGRIKDMPDQSKGMVR
jgi:hypothetical protein